MNLHTVCIVRHGIAEDYGAGGSDAARRLTPDGIEKTRRAARGLKKIGVDPQLILTSPLCRAEETARIVSQILDDASIRVTTTLSPGADHAAVIREALEPPRPSAVMFVGHQPDLGMLASWLLTGDPSRTPLPFRKAGAACIAISGSPERLHGTLQWFLTPAQLRGLADG